MYQHDDSGKYSEHYTCKADAANVYCAFCLGEILLLTTCRQYIWHYFYTLNSLTAIL